MICFIKLRAESSALLPTVCLQVVYLMANIPWVAQKSFTMTLFADLKMDLPYQDVRDGKWTIDRMIEITKDQWIDLDGNNVQSGDDQLGFCALNYVCDSFYPASNLRYIDEDETDMLVLSPDFGSTKTVKLINKLGAWAATDSIWITSGNHSTEEEQNATRKIFPQGKVLVWMEHACFAESSLLTVNFEYGLVPNPKYDEKQVNYYTGMGNPWSLYGVFRDFDDRGDKQATLTMFTAIFECYASEGYRLTTPEIFEVNMQLKYSAGQDETDMFEYVRSGIVFDLGKIFSLELDNMSELASNSIVGNTSWSSSYKSYVKSINNKLTNLVENFKVYQNRA